MAKSRPDYDVAVVGGGPVGAVTAIAFGRQGARVALLEANPQAARRFAGEWIHPPGVAVLDRLRAGRLDRAEPRTGYGFMIFPDDGTPPIEMPYQGGVSLACEHEGIVESLREVARSIDGVDYLPGTRVHAIEGHRLTVEHSGTRCDLHAGRIVGADGRSSIVRKALGLDPASKPLSHMASVLLTEVTLPFEGFGHVVLGGPGPILMYRIGENQVRVCLDLPLSYGEAARRPPVLWDAFNRVMPKALLPAFRRALADGPIAWAVNRFRPRSGFGRGHIAIVGDALGHVHPLTALGMTVGFLDAEAIANARSIEEYARARRSLVPELLANALYHCFQREDASATAMRQTMFHVLRQSETERARTLSILSGAEPRVSRFTASFLRMAAGAVRDTLSDTLTRGDLRGLPDRLSAFGEWLQWPAASWIPRPVAERYRPHSSSVHPIPALSRFVTLPTTVAEPVPDAAPRIPAREPDVEKARAEIHERLLHELEGLAMQYGRVPDRDLARPGLSMMHAIVSGPTRVGLAARMKIGRHRLAHEGIERLVALAVERDCETRDLAALLLILAPTPETRKRIVGFEAAVDALFGARATGGGFARRICFQRGSNARWEPVPDAGNLEATAIACRALVAVAEAFGEEMRDACDRALEGVAEWLLRLQREDGSFPAREADDDVTATAFAVEALAVIHAAHPSVRRGATWLASQLGDDGLIQGAKRPRLATARAARALLIASSARVAPLHTMLAALARETSALVGALVDGQDAADEVSPRRLQEMCEVLEAMSIYAARRKGSPVLGRRAPRARAPMVTTSPADIAYCKKALEGVSRTFSRPIALLPPPLDDAVTVAYLLCRVADTFEDHPRVSAAARGPMLDMFVEMLAGEREPRDVAQGLAPIDGEDDDAELSLVRHLPTVMRVFVSFPEPIRTASAAWVSEMARGMNVYVHRRAGPDGLLALHTPEDLERYCYFVAGTVGHLLTDLFVYHLGPMSPPVRLALRENAEAFGMGLQLVNILKDITDDRARSVSFVPRTLAAAQALELDALCDPHNREEAHAAVEPLFATARRLLDRALDYSLAIPASATGVRLFCLLPLWMAARTLAVAARNDALFIAGEPVKISRDEVERIIATCSAHAADDAYLRGAYEALWTGLDDAGARRSTA
jgi:phytoene/squalene synthetase/2-polyprenyl-6-methoxyphenol hydroxylase-like FAD-dependent oxidoreductase